MDDLLSAFAEALLLKNLQRKTTTAQSSEASSSRIDPSTQPADTEQHVVSLSPFPQIWREKGWHYVQFRFADHNESKRSTGDAICRVLLGAPRTYVSQRQSIRGDTQADEPSAFSFADLKQLLKIMAVPFALYMFWSTQLYPASGIVSSIVALRWSGSRSNKTTTTCYSISPAQFRSSCFKRREQDHLLMPRQRIWSKSCVDSSGVSLRRRRRAAPRPRRPQSRSHPTCKRKQPTDLDAGRLGKMTLQLDSTMRGWDRIRFLTLYRRHGCQPVASELAFGSRHVLVGSQ